MGAWMMEERCRICGKSSRTSVPGDAVGGDRVEGGGAGGGLEVMSKKSKAHASVGSFERARARLRVQKDISRTRA